ncbi:alpha/beta hydrolase-fold protein [Elizabethkingia ursingii]|uniref:alpha/beta hydrolase-fold protein n=1 Tax=Elizabethkingia ursingii TaxID=1756150 RepID=UPI00201100C3|nr:alpha/beta hydrolase-fold protein [Elizabethkingia ursingii]MCL1668807.1 alpha/beta hydrolase-fold protein [Elizabethkingia ursingii]
MILMISGFKNILKNSINAFIVLSSFILNTGFSSAQSTNDMIVMGQRHSIQSKILNENRTYSVYLPASYKSNPNKRYIVAYVLDGERSKFLEVSGISQSMHSSFNLKLQIPELIIVSIENTDRTRDFTPTNSLNYLDKEDIAAFKSSGKANDFMNFIEKELMPEINNSFRAVPQNMIIGHSMGGLFALHCLLENPKMFSYYLLIDPSWFWDHNYIGKRGKEILEKQIDLKARVYIALANNFHEDKRHYQWGMEFYELLKKNKSPDLRAEVKYFEDEKHLTVTIPATYYGLRYLFQPYEIDINEVTKDPKVLANYDKKIQKELFLDMKPDENFVNTIGYIALHDRQLPDIAVSVFEINAKNYPQSLNVWDSLADVYIVKGYIEKAKMCYKKILALSPDNSNAKSKLEKLNKY